ncbi:MAG TPA: Fur family transcriptional regulator [Solirubrobacterales bacterium]|nr:Fur family transcriptional regulator [Solirubrobacterales bacterium]
MGWAEQATTRLDEAGFRSGGSRRQVIELLGGERCALTALEIDRRLESVGRATVYRTLEQLERLHLVQRVEIGGDAAGYERLDPEAHHHHLVCEACGRLAPFASEALEAAIEAVGRHSDFSVVAHDVVLRGTCAACGGSDA